ncbi:MAG: hypothetical protein HC933_18675 [Pleurocapsa sp. SU_196_0]|nr:hypothetical protein [Pleurocapsa sp. SU_196_0]
MNTRFSITRLVVSVALGLFVACTSLQGQGASTPARLEPQATGSVAFYIGQVTPELSSFKQQVLDRDASFPRPGGITLYTNITPGTCNGLTSTCTLDGNTFNFNQSLAEYPGAGLAVGVYLSDCGTNNCANQPLRALIGRSEAERLACQVGRPANCNPQTDITTTLTGQYRSNLDTLVNYLKNTGRTVLLRFGYEFDGPWNGYNNEFYKSAFRFAKNRVNALGATNVKMVWQSASYVVDGSAQYFQNFSDPNHLNAFYPGDDVVDYVAMSTFMFPSTMNRQWFNGCPSAPTTSNPLTLYNAVMNFARAHAKPVMIAEASPQGYRTDTLTGACVGLGGGTVPNKHPVSQAELTGWFTDYFNLIKNNLDVIRVAAYINLDWERIQIFACNPGCNGGYWGNSRIQDNVSLLSFVKTQLQNSPFSTTTPPPTDNPPAGYTRCASENQTCSFNGTAKVVFGARSSFTTPRTFTNNVNCTTTVFGNPIAGVAKACYYQLTTNPPTGGSIPGVVTTTSFTGSKSFTVTPASSGNYYFKVTYNATQASQLITVNFNGSSTNGATGAGSNLSYQSIDFTGVSSGAKMLTVTAGTGVTITKLEAVKR